MTTTTDPSVNDWAVAVAAWRRNDRRVQRPHWWRELVTDAWRCADEAWQLQREEVAIGYRTEMAEFQAEIPRPRLGDFMSHLSLGERP